jgi:hypothetical protein
MARKVGGCAVLLISFFALSGCGGRGDTVLLDTAFEVSLEGVRTPFITPKDKQKFEVTVSAGEPVNIYIFKEGDEAAIKDIRQGIVTQRVLAHQEKTKEATLEPALPAASKVFIFINRAADKSTHARLKVIAKKKDG